MSEYERAVTDEDVLVWGENLLLPDEPISGGTPAEHEASKVVARVNAWTRRGKPIDEAGMLLRDIAYARRALGAWSRPIVSPFGESWDSLLFGTVRRYVLLSVEGRTLPEAKEEKPDPSAPPPTPPV